MTMEDRSDRNRNLAIIVIVVTAAVIGGTVLYVIQMELPEDHTPPSKVEGLEIYDLRDGRLFLFWDEATDNRKVVAYQIYRDGNLLPTEPSYPFYVDTALIDGTLYFYQVRAVDSSDNVGDFSNTVSCMPTPSDNVPPSRVEGLVVENAFDGKLNLTWDMGFDNVAVDHYTIHRDGVTLVDEPRTTFFQDTGLTNGQIYSYEVAAVDTSGNEGQRSVQVSGMSTEYDSEPPSKVMALVVTDARDGKLNLTWDSATDNVGVAKYYVYRDGPRLTDEPTGTAFQDTGLVDGQLYEYEVSAVDAQGNEGPKSDAVSGTPTSSVPSVSTSGSIHNATAYNITVLFVSEALDIGIFGAFLETDSNETDRMDPLSDGATAGNITFLDMDSDGLLTVGDVFVIGISSGHDYRFSMFWRATDDIVDTHLWTVP